MTTHGDSVSWPASDLEEVPACPVCAATLGAPRFHGLADPLHPHNPPRWALAPCATCACLVLSPRPTQSAIGRAYETYFTHGPPGLPPDPSTRFGRARRSVRDIEWGRVFGYDMPVASSVVTHALSTAPWARAAAARTIRSVPAPHEGARLLDVGCANGEYLVQMRALGWAVEGIETDPVARAHAEGAGISVRDGLLDASVPSGSFEAVTLGHVIEHVHDPSAFLAECLRVLRPGGLLWLATPNVDASGLRRFGASYVQLDPPRHLVIFSRTALRSLLGRVGFIEIRDAGALPQASAWTFARSNAIRQGLGSHPDPLPGLPRRLRIAALIADLRAHLSPRRAEEIVMTARKPLRDD